MHSNDKLVLNLQQVVESDYFYQKKSILSYIEKIRFPYI